MKTVSNKRAKNEDISVMNCLYADIDAKQFGDIGKAGLETCKQRAMDHINRLPVPPNVIVDSGGGYQCFWLLKEPFYITDENSRRRAQEVLANWVTFVGGDQGAKDLARVFRAPGTKNYKPEYGPDYPVVTIIKADFS